MNQKQLKKLLFILQPESCSYGCTVGEEPSLSVYAGTGDNEKFGL